MVHTVNTKHNATVAATTQQIKTLTHTAAFYSESNFSEGMSKVVSVAEIYVYDIGQMFQHIIDFVLQADLSSLPAS